MSNTINPNANFNRGEIKLTEKEEKGLNALMRFSDHNHHIQCTCNAFFEYKLHFKSIFVKINIIAYDEQKSLLGYSLKLFSLVM